MSRASVSMKALVRMVWPGILLVAFPAAAWATPDSDFQARCSAAGVVRCIAFDSAADVTADPGFSTSTGMFAGPVTAPTLDSAVKASGNSSLKFTIPAGSVGGGAGSFAINFSPDVSIQFGEGQEFYVQWRQRFSSEFIDPGAGWKQTIIGEGDRPGVPVYSCTQLEVVSQNSYRRGFAQMYHSCGLKDGNYEALYEPYGAYDFKLQNAMPSPYCLYSTQSTGYPGCFKYKPNQWMTFQVRIKIGTWYKNDGNYHRDSAIQMWIAEEGQPSQLVHSWLAYDLANNNPDAKYGKIWLLPYSGSDTFAQGGTTWYDELIISRNRIADPGGSSSGPPLAPTGLRVQ